ncbi:shikimate dehydrogenase family protein [Nonomuraea endophytica]|uniref:Shikimate dehydrogenase (NADP(+)) n=1 Tax=Nonomuraea endophytica TaxID=714136 RepID=A0A7W8EI20_9ACTN|nr:shikimate dehydrogenase [Nonomuraea endophytica]MBB5079197.1 shikimate dehydrogenase [Nonomuraea endophytica]
MRTVALFGNPLRRTHSAVMHNAAFAAFGVDARYELREVRESDLAEQVRQARDERWLGFQITAPHKQVIMPFLDAIEPDALRIGAVNSVTAGADGRLVGFNTDVSGFMTALREHVGTDLSGAEVVVAGSGGVSHAVSYGLAKDGAGHLTVLDLDAADAGRLAARFGDLATIEPMAFADPRVRDRLAGADLFVNATSVGMLTPGPVVDVGLISPCAAVFDVVYLPPLTELVRRARARGMRAAGGAGMLVAQAAAAFSRWTGAGDATAVMRAAVEPLLRRDDLTP